MLWCDVASSKPWGKHKYVELLRCRLKVTPWSDFIYSCSTCVCVCPCRMYLVPIYLLLNCRVKEYTVQCTNCARETDDGLRLNRRKPKKQQQSVWELIERPQSAIRELQKASDDYTGQEEHFVDSNNFSFVLLDRPVNDCVSIYTHLKMNLLLQVILQEWHCWRLFVHWPVLFYCSLLMWFK